jgi:hypothetical protein
VSVPALKPWDIVIIDEIESCTQELQANFRDATDLDEKVQALEGKAWVLT